MLKWAYSAIQIPVYDPINMNRHLSMATYGSEASQTESGVSLLFEDGQYDIDKISLFFNRPPKLLLIERRICYTMRTQTKR